MRFGLFGGARMNEAPSAGPSGAMTGDSLHLSHYIDYVLLAEEIGFTNLFMVEHHFTGGGQVSSSLGLLLYLAARTRRIRLGTAVVVLPWHNPAILAETVATLDVLSNGRFDFGIGKGYRAEEFAGFCIPTGEASDRFDETLKFLRSALTNTERFSHHGQHWHFDNVVIEPRVIQRPHPPFWMGANSDESIRRAAREGVNLLLDQVTPISAIQRRVEIYREERSAVHGDFAPEQIAVTRGFYLVGNEGARLDAMGRYADLLDGAGALKWLAGEDRAENRRRYLEGDAPLIGTPEQVVARLKLLEAAGVETVLLSDMSGSPASLRTFANEIMPALAPAPARSLEGAK